MHQFKWTTDKQIGSLPKNWNVLVGEQKIPKKINALHLLLEGHILKTTRNVLDQNIGSNIKNKFFDIRL